MANYGIKVSKAGYDIKTTGLENQVFNSSANSLKIWMAGHANISVSAYTGFGGTGIGTTNITHSLGYAPYFLCYFKIKHASKLWFQDSVDDSVLFGNYIQSWVWSDSTYLTMHITVSGNVLGAFTAVGYYYIFCELFFKCMMNTNKQTIELLS